MTKNEMTAAMFEEIKEKMAIMDEKQGDIAFNQQQTNANIEKGIEEQKKPQKADNLVKYLLDSIRGIVNASADNLSEENSKIVSKINEQAEVYRELISELKQELNKRKVLMVKTIGFQIALAISIMFNIYMLNGNRGLKDSELQLKYLKVTNNVDDELTGRLDTIFNIYRNEEAIEFIRQTIKDR